MKWILGVVAAVVLVGGALAAGVATHVVHVDLGLRRPARPAAVHPVSVAIPAITTNLSDPGGGHFAQVAITVTLSSAAVATAFQAKLPAVEDAVIADLRQRSTAQLDAPDGMTGLQRAVSTSLQQLLGPGSVKAVYFTQFIVQ